MKEAKKEIKQINTKNFIHKQSNTEHGGGKKEAQLSRRETKRENKADNGNTNDHENEPQAYWAKELY